MPKVEMDVETTVDPARLRAALLDFSPKRPELWPGISPDLYEVYEVGQSTADVKEGTRSPGMTVWAKERYDWSDPKTITWTVHESNFCAPGSYVSATITPREDGGSRVHIEWNRTPTSFTGRLATLMIKLSKGKPIAASFQKAMTQLERSPKEGLTDEQSDPNVPVRGDDRGDRRCRRGEEPMIRIESSVTIDRPISEVYAFVSDCRNEPKWHTDVIEATGETAVGAVQTWVLRFMGRRESNMKVSRLETERLEELQAQRSLLGMRPTISYLYEPVGSQTRFTRRIDMHVGGIAKIMPVRSMTTKRNQHFVSNLKSVLEKA